MSATLESEAAETPVTVPEEQPLYDPMDTDADNLLSEGDRDESPISLLQEQRLIPTDPANFGLCTLFYRQEVRDLNKIEDFPVNPQSECLSMGSCLETPAVMPKTSPRHMLIPYPSQRM